MKLWPQADSEDILLRAYDAHADAIFRHCYFRVSNRERAKELLQETFMKTWEYLKDGGRVDNIKAFLYRVATNLITDEYRKRKAVSLDTLMEDEGFEIDAHDHSIEAVAAVHDVTKFLREIDSDVRQLVVMRFIDDLPIKEIAAIVDETENNVSVKIHRAIEKMKKHSQYYGF